MRSTKNGIHSSDFDVVFLSPILLNGEENHIGMLRADLGYAFDLYVFPPPKLVATSVNEKRRNNKKRDTFQLWGTKSTAYECGQKIYLNKKSNWHKV